MAVPLLLGFAYLAHHAVRHAATHAARHAATHAARHAVNQVAMQAQATSYPVNQVVSKPDVYIHGYQRKNGVYVHSHHRSQPDGIKSNNWSHKGNVNPYTNQIGTENS
ncbi:MAG: hypothetical protein H0X31_06065 [Nostocaceae cyanobacterium]|nr:hypothetical protein [Nostocaceae cyanobacterium]